ncbi:hypothetical protein CRM22_008477, partial [Opisthorchis felineus]
GASFLSLGALRVPTGNFDTACATYSHMALVTYSSSDDEPEAISDNMEKLELPTFFHGLEADSIRFAAHKDDPTMHQLRHRSFAHEVGQWASCVYIDCSSILSTILKQFLSALHLSEHPLWQCLHSVDDVHVSLSKTWPLRYHWIDSLEDKLRNTFQNLSRFDIRFSGLELFINEERSRSFIGLILSRESSEHLKPIVASVDHCVHAFCGPGYYKNPRFHASLLWCNGDLECKLKELDLSRMEVLFQQTVQLNCGDLSVCVNCIMC